MKVYHWLSEIFFSQALSALLIQLTSRVRSILLPGSIFSMSHDGSMGRRLFYLLIQHKDELNVGKHTMSHGSGNKHLPFPPKMYGTSNHKHNHDNIMAIPAPDSPPQNCPRIPARHHFTSRHKKFCTVDGGSSHTPPLKSGEWRNHSPIYYISETKIHTQTFQDLWRLTWH